MSCGTRTSPENFNIGIVLADERHTHPRQQVRPCPRRLNAQRGRVHPRLRVDRDGMLDACVRSYPCMRRANRPSFGIEFAVEEKPEQLEKLRVHRGR